MFRSAPWISGRSRGRQRLIFPRCPIGKKGTQKFHSSSLGYSLFLSVQCLLSAGLTGCAMSVHGAVITKIPFTWWLKQQDFISHSFGGWEVYLELVPGKSQLSHTPHGGTGKRSSLGSLSQGLPFVKASRSRLNHLPQTSLLIPSHWGLGVNT